MDENKIAELGQTGTAYKLRSPPKLVGAPLYMGFLYGPTPEKAKQGYNTALGHKGGNERKRLGHIRDL